MLWLNFIAYQKLVICGNSERQYMARVSFASFAGFVATQDFPFFLPCF